MPFNAHEDAARERKATAIADLLWLGGITAAAAREMTSRERNLSAASAGQHDPTVHADGSCPTWDRVVALLARREAMAARFAEPADPFDGLTEADAAANQRARNHRPAYRLNKADYLDRYGAEPPEIQ